MARSKYRIVKTLNKETGTECFIVEYRDWGFWHYYSWLVTKRSPEPDVYTHICNTIEEAKARLKECRESRTRTVVYEE